MIFVTRKHHCFEIQGIACEEYDVFSKRIYSLSTIDYVSRVVYGNIVKFIFFLEVNVYFHIIIFFF